MLRVRGVWLVVGAVVVVCRGGDSLGTRRLKAWNAEKTAAHREKLRELEPPTTSEVMTVPLATPGGTEVCWAHLRARGVVADDTHFLCAHCHGAHFWTRAVVIDGGFVLNAFCNSVIL